MTTPPRDSSDTLTSTPMVPGATPSPPSARGGETPGPGTVTGPIMSGNITGRITRDSELPGVPRMPPLAPETRRGQRIALAGLLIVTFAVAAWIASALWAGIALGVVMAFTAQPVYRRLARRMGDRRPLAAGIVTTGMGLSATAMGALFLYVAVNQLLTIGTLLEKKIQAGTLISLVGESGIRLIDKLGIGRALVLNKIQDGLASVASRAAGSAAVVLSAATGALLGMLVALLTMYYVLIEWRTLIVRIERVLPIDPRHTRMLILEFREVGRAVLVGTVATAIIQGCLAGIAYGALGVPQATTWAIATGFGSFLPVIGTGIVWAPIGAYLIASGRPVAGVLVLVWGFFVVTTATDYVIRPRLVGRKVGHPLLVLFALLGGIEVLGLPGLIVAPILMSLFLAVLRIYEREIRLSHRIVHE
jgi:predicted PurR-regulated permease PerM